MTATEKTKRRSRVRIDTTSGLRLLDRKFAPRWHKILGVKCVSHVAVSSIDRIDTTRLYAVSEPKTGLRIISGFTSRILAIDAARKEIKAHGGSKGIRKSIECWLKYRDKDRLMALGKKLRRKI
jgi:hypothetical protein